jgi:hypothetical protein
MASKREQLVKVEPVEPIEAELVDSLPPEASLPTGLPTTAAELNRLVDLRVAEALARRDDWQPYFQSRRVAQELKRIQSVPEQRLWSLVYERWGCTHCDTKERPHASCGMCGRCRVKIGCRRETMRREQSGEKEHPAPRACEDCGRRFPPMTDTKWESAYEQHKVSKHHTQKVLYPEGAVARSCEICAKDFRPMSGAQWKYVRRKHERGERHRRALRKRKAHR